MDEEITHSVPHGPPYQTRDVDNDPKPAAAGAEYHCMRQHPEHHIDNLRECTPL